MGGGMAGMRGMGGAMRKDALVCEIETRRWTRDENVFASWYGLPVSRVGH